ncbi:MAG: mandelate racemase [Acidobacteria bacterium]|nr:mandelate racemase [Acidobacteriota bacterium]
MGHPRALRRRPASRGPGLGPGIGPVTLPRLTVRWLRAVPVTVPMKHALGTSAATVRTAPVLLVDLETHQGVTGRAYQFCYRPAAAPAIVCFLDDILEAITGAPLVPADLWSVLSKRYTLIGVQGIVRMAMALVDVASWDALAQAAGLPLVRLVGGIPRPVPAYNSNGLGLMRVDALADEAERLLERGFRGVKLRLGYPTLEEDLAAVRAVRGRISDDIALMVDYNQALTMAEAIRRARALDEEGVYWIEEPIRHDDYAGCAQIAHAAATPVQIGENFSQVYDMEKALAAGACDYVMPDLERIGGVTGWQRASALAAGAAVPLSSHLYPEVSAQLLAATPTAHWLEYVDWMTPLLAEPLRIVDGMAVIPDRPGNGLLWNPGAVRRYAA